MVRRLGPMLLMVVGCAHPRAPAKTSLAAIVPPSRVAFVTELSCADLELVVPYYEGLRFVSAAAALASAKSEYLELAYPGALSMPMVAWKCGETWTAITTTTPMTTPVSLVIRAQAPVDVRLECFGPCEFQRIETRGSWQAMAKDVARAMNVRPSPPLSQRYDAMRFFVRTWVAHEGDPLRTDWAPEPLAERMKAESPRTMAFVFGLDPNEVDLEGRYFWTAGAEAEVRALNQGPAGHHHWLNLRSYKYAIPRLGITRELPPEIRAAAKVTKKGIDDFDQYVFKAVTMCLASETWQRSRLDEMKRLLDLGFRVIALDEYPAARTWNAEPCRAAGHLHRPGDFADEQRITIDLVRKHADMAHAHGALLSSEEPSLGLLPFTSGYMDGAFDEPADMYEHWSNKNGIERIPLFSTMFDITPYTRPAKSHHAPKGWIVQEQVGQGHAP